MSNSLLQQLRNHLASISKEEFQTEWATIVAMGFGGITVQEFISSSLMPASVMEIKSFAEVTSLVSEEYKNLESPDFNYLMAA